MANHPKILDNVPKMLLEYESWMHPYKVTVRPSALPFCPVQYLFAALDPINISAGDSFIERIFAAIGETSHDVIQTYLGRAGVLYGCWKCKKCYWESGYKLGTPYCGDAKLEWTRGRDKEGQEIGPEAPCNNGYATRYVEITVKDPETGIIGHCDGLILIAGHLYLLEIKTKATSAIVRGLKEPDHTHICQATMYAELATPKEWGLEQEVEGIAFCYVPRDWPNKMRFIFHDRDATSLQDTRRDVPKAAEILENGNIEDARAVCPDEKYARKVKYCEYAGQCFRPDRTEFLKKLWKKAQKAKERDGSDRQDSVQESD